MDRNGYIAVINTDKYVALRKESVDRNKAVARISSYPNGRSPQGERG